MKTYHSKKYILRVLIPFFGFICWNCVFCLHPTMVFGLLGLYLSYHFLLLSRTSFGFATKAKGSQRCGPRLKLKSHISCSRECRRVWGNEPTHSQVGSNHALTNLLFGLCMFVWIIDLLVTHPSPHPEVQHALLLLKCYDLGSVPNSFFHHFHFWTRIWVFQGVWGCVNYPHIFYDGKLSCDLLYMMTRVQI